MQKGGTQILQIKKRDQKKDKKLCLNKKVHADLAEKKRDKKIK